VTYLCAPIFVRDVEQARRDINAAVLAGAEMIELRIDELKETTILKALLESKKCPVIVTCRPKWEGGHSTATDEWRITTLALAIEFGADYVDYELNGIDEVKGNLIHHAGRLIVSNHHFEGRPERLYNLVADMNRLPARVNKIAWTARSVRDNVEAFELLQQRSRPTIALCMGEAGVISRILARKFGAFLTFASLNAEAATAPGQISLSEMKGLYRWDKISSQTRVYGVVAHPVAHSMSPAIHNAAFDATGFDGVYLPFLVQPGYESFKAFMESFLPFGPLHLSGLSVTLPHKENALRYLQEKGGEVEALAARIGAVNTIVIDRSGAEPKLSGINTDYAAILDSITESLVCQRKDLAGMSVAVLGAGGTGRTAVAALSHCGAMVTIFNRTPAKAAALAEDFPGVAVEPWEKLGNSDCRIYINTTSVGMHPKIGVSPFGDHPPKLRPETLVFDTIYNPMQTHLLFQARAAGAKTVGGVDMFVRQAAAQFTAWTRQPAPIDVMRRGVEERLNRL
jgi:3-dehydroquinate dehydratase / shikimate dehydrogenase